MLFFPVAIAVRSGASYRYSMRSGFVLCCDCHTLVEFGCQPWSCFRKSQRTVELCLWYFLPAIQVSDGVLTSFSKRAPSAEQASTSENDDKFSLRIFTSFSSSCYSCSKRRASYRYSMRSDFVLCCDCHTLFKRAPVTGRTSTSKTGNAQLCWAYPSFLQWFRPLVWLSHSSVYQRIVLIFLLGSTSRGRRWLGRRPRKSGFGQRGGPYSSHKNRSQWWAR